VPTSIDAVQDDRRPAADHHQHLFSPVIASASGIEPITAADLIALLDAAGIRRAVVLSQAYAFGNPNRTPQVQNERARVVEENNWTSHEVERFPGRLVGFCGVNPLKDYALQEVKRCAGIPQLRAGLKLHMGNSVVDYGNPRHIERLKEIFRLANDSRMAIVVHMRASFSQKLSYGRAEARIFLTEVVPAAPDVPIQIAHLAGGGAPADPAADEALTVFVEAIAAGDPRTRNMYFDVTGVAQPTASDERRALIARQVRQIGLQRILYGSDTASGGNPPPREAWAAFRTLPLTAAEFQTIAGNLAPYLR